MENRITVTEGTMVIRVPKELDHHTATEIKECTDFLVEKEGIRTIVFDFGETDFMDSSGIGMLMGRYKLMRCAGGHLKACNLKPRVAKIFTMSGLETIVELIRK